MRFVGGLKSGEKSTRGINVELVTHYEADTGGSATLHLIGGATVALTKDQWAEVAPELGVEPEPAAAGK
jgi:hypothetical protein